MKRLFPRSNKQQFTDLKDQAVRKASQLVQLLSSQLQKQKQLREQSVSQLKNLKAMVQQFYTRQNQYIKFQREKGQLEDQIKKSQQQLNKKNEEVKAYQDKNKQLHLKVADYLQKNKMLALSVDELKIKNSSLQNQNNYLLETYKDFKQKQKQFNNLKSKNVDNIQKELTQMTNLKNAFANRVQQLTKQLNEARKKHIYRDKENYNFQRSNQNLPLIKEIEILHRQNQLLIIENSEYKAKLFERQRRFIEENHLKRQFAQTKKYSSDKADQIYEFIDRLYTELKLKPNKFGKREEIALSKYLQTNQFLLKNLEYFICVIIKLSTKFLRKLDPNLYKITTIDQVIELTEQLIAKLYLQ